MRRIGHRGAKGHVAENTIASFQKAFELGCDEVETDVWLTPEGRLVISHDAPPADAKLRLVGRATIDGKSLEHDATGGRPTVVEPVDIVTTTGQSEVAIVPGRETCLDVTVERRNGFKGRIPIEVRGLSGAIARLAQAQGVPAPTHAFIAAALAPFTDGKPKV